MSFFAKIEEFWLNFTGKVKPLCEKTAGVFRKIGKVLRIVWAYIYRLRTVFMAVPVVIAAIVLAVMNLGRLPDSTGLWLLTNGEFLILVPKLVAVLAPIAITALSILLVLCSKKAFYPWLISIFTLVLPLLIYYTNDISGVKFWLNYLLK